MANTSLENAFKLFEKRLAVLQEVDKKGESGFAREFKVLYNIGTVNVE